MKSSENFKEKTELNSNGKLEAYVFLKKWIEAYQNTIPKNGLFSTIKYYLTSFSLGLLLLLLVIGIILWGVLLFLGIVFGISFFINIDWFIYVCAAILAVWMGTVSGGLEVAEDFVDSGFLSKYRVNSLEKIKSNFVDKFVQKFGFSYMNPKIEDLQKVQDFIVWQKKIAENFLSDEPNDDGWGKELAISFFDKKLNALKNEFLKKKTFIKVTRTSAAATKELIENAMKNNEFREIFKSLQEGNLKFGDLTNGNEDRLIEWARK